jgi:hypothetical protein
VSHCSLFYSTIAALTASNNNFSLAQLTAWYALVCGGFASGSSRFDNYISNKLTILLSFQMQTITQTVPLSSENVINNSRNADVYGMFYLPGVTSVTVSDSVFISNTFTAHYYDTSPTYSDCTAFGNSFTFPDGVTVVAAKPATKNNDIPHHCFPSPAQPPTPTAFFTLSFAAMRRRVVRIVA